MNNNLILLIEKISNDKKLYAGFMEQATLEDLYKFSIKIQSGYTIQELKEFMTKIINFIENSKIVSLNSENDLNKVSGGASIKSKILSVALTPLMAMSSIPVSGVAASGDTIVNNKVNSSKDKSFMNKFKKAILIGGGGIAALSGAAYAIAGYMNNRVKLTADDWFTILGGDPDIEFNDCSNKTISTLEQDQIDKDMDRLNFTAFNFNSKSSENSARTIITDIITHWCKVHFVPGSKGAYVQGYDRYATLVLYKFLQTYNIEELLSNDTLKAKMDYVFECIMRVVVWGFNKYIPNDKSDPTIQQTKDDFTKNYGDTLFGILCYKIFVTRGTDDFSIQQHEIIWDIILSKIPPQNFFANQKMPSAVNTLYDNLMKKIFKQLDNSNIDNSNIFSERFRGVANKVLASSFLPQEWDKIIRDQGL